MNRHLLVSLLVCGLFTTGLLARQGMVLLKDGQRIEGDITSDAPDQITINVRGIETSVSRDRVESVVYYDSIKQVFDERKAKLGAEDAAGHIALARWAFDNRLYAEARALLDEVLDKIDPNNREAAELRTLVRRQIELERRAETRPPRDPDQPDAPRGAGPRAPAPTAENLLTPEQVRQIKVGEARPQEPNLRLSVPADVRRNVVRAAPGASARNFERLSALEKLKVIQEYGTPEDQARVELQGDPVVLQEFRQRIQPIVLAGCASAGCHNTPEAGNFMLFERAQDERSSYTNFYILHRYTKQMKSGGQGGIFDGAAAELRMIDRMRPADSLLLHYMLPANLTQNPHPQAAGFQPVARDRNDQRFQQVARWLSALNRVMPNYDIDYTPPQKQAPATQPADQPSAPGARR